MTVRKHTSIPVPAVLDWSDDPANAIGTEFIIMKHVAGVQLHHEWPSMNVVQHISVVSSLAITIQELSKLEFLYYGSLYYADAPVDKNDLIPIADGFCIGPHCFNRYWPVIVGDDRYYQRRPPNRGPCESTVSQHVPYAKTP